MDLRVRGVPVRTGVLLLGAMLLSSVVPAQDTTRTQGVRIGLTYALGTRPGVFVAPVVGAYADSVRAILARDLDFGDRVNPIVPDGGDPPGGVLNYPVYAQMGALAVVQASVTPAGSLHVAVHDVAAARVLTVLDVPLPQPALGPDWRHAVHGVSDDIERWVTQQRGIAQTRILYERGRSLWIVDADGANAHLLTGTESGLSPAWHPGGKYIAYGVLGDDGQHIVLRDLAAGTAKRVSTRGGTNETPAFSPDGSTLVYASGLDGMDLYAIAPFGKEPTLRLTVARGSTLSVEPSFSPDGKRMVFTSDRLGHPEVYIMDADGTNQDLLTTMAFGEQQYRSNPDWSPDGRRVAFQSQVNGIFQLMTINPRDANVVPLTSEGSNEDPSWAPDARHLVFTSTRSGAQQLWVLDTESGRLRQLTHGPLARMSAWSPRLQVTP